MALRLVDKKVDQKDHCSVGRWAGDSDRPWVDRMALLRAGSLALHSIEPKADWMACHWVDPMAALMDRRSVDKTAGKKGLQLVQMTVTWAD